MIPKKLLNQEIGFFDIDSRELSPDGLGFKLRERMQPLESQLNLLYDFAYKHQLMFIFSTCCSGNFLKTDSLDYVKFIPIDASDQSWTKDLENFRYFYIEKKQYGNPRVNCERCAYDFFKYNNNAMKLVKKLKLKKWVIFGNSFDSCVYLACLHLLSNGLELTVIKDAVAPGYGPGKTGTEENKKNILSELKAKGTKILTVADFLKKFETT
jgi:hypothetical protein